MEAYIDHAGIILSFHVKYQCNTLAFNTPKIGQKPHFCSFLAVVRIKDPPGECWIFNLGG